MAGIAKKVLSQENFAKLGEIIGNHRNERGALIEILHEAQRVFGYLPFEVQKIIADRLNKPLAEVYSVVTFYSEFTTEPKGENIIGICLGTACYVKGAQLILDELKELLGVEVGETTADGKFTLLAMRCLGACGLAPVMTINKKVYGNVKVSDINKILLEYI